MNNSIDTTIGSRIRSLRDSAGLSQAELAERLGVGWRHLSNLERDVNKPSLETICKLSDVLSVSCDYLLLGKNPDDLPVSFERIKYLNQKHRMMLTEQIDLMMEAQRNKEQ